jgi:hypothetical protein
MKKVFQFITAIAFCAGRDFGNVRTLIGGVDAQQGTGKQQDDPCHLSRNRRAKRGTISEFSSA